MDSAKQILIGQSGTTVILLGQRVDRLNLSVKSGNRKATTD